jgi:hypothetical protein
MANDQLTLECTSSVVVNAFADNIITLKVVCQETIPDLFAALFIPCGVKDGATTFLLGSTSEEIQVVGSPIFTLQNPEDNQQVWKTSRFTLEAGQTLTVGISGFSASQGDGQASVTLQIRQKTKQLLDKTCAITITLPKDDDKPSIHYLAADRISRIYSEKTHVVFSSYTTKAKRLRLKNLTTPGQQWISQSETLDRANKFSVPAPPITSTYQLEAWQSEFVDDPQNAVHDVSDEITITVQQAGETSIVFQEQGRPLLVRAGDLKGDSKPRLYGVFSRDAGDPALLWSTGSSMGGWTQESALPDGMDESPGVIHKGGLWLIGGCSANPTGPRSNRVRCYRKNSKNELGWNDLPDAPFAPRMGHACVAFKEKIWVMGGLDADNQPLNDIWHCTVNPNEKEDGTLEAPVWQQVSPAASWSPRCMFAAAVKPASATQYFQEESLWICGGTRHPYRGDVVADFWYSEDGKEWTNKTSDLKFPGGDLGTALGPPLGAALLYDEKNKYLILAGAFRVSGGIAASRHYLSLAMGSRLEWMKQDSKLTGNWSDPFLIRSAILNNIQLFVPVYGRPGAEPADAKLYLYIP